MKSDILITDDPDVLWPGFAEVNTEGMALACEMFIELEEVPPDALSTGGLSSLKNADRRGKPFRNAVAEYLARAEAAGPQVAEGFCAVLSDYVSNCLQGSVPDVSYYDVVAGTTEEEVSS